MSIQLAVGIRVVDHRSYTQMKNKHRIIKKQVKIPKKKRTFITLSYYYSLSYRSSYFLDTLFLNLLYILFFISTKKKFGHLTSITN